MTWPADAVALTTDRFGLSICEAEGPLVPREQVVALAQALKDELNFTFFVYVVAVHYPAVAAVDADEEKGVEAADAMPDRTEVHYRVRRLATADRTTDTSVSPSPPESRRHPWRTSGRVQTGRSESSSISSGPSSLTTRIFAES